VVPTPPSPPPGDLRSVAVAGAPLRSIAGRSVDGSASCPRLLDATVRSGRATMERVATALFVCTVVVAVRLDVVAAGSCGEAKLCCPGRDSSCVVQKAPLNAIIEDLSDKPCYCDHACLKLGDCCKDFKEACGGKERQISVATREICRGGVGVPRDPVSGRFLAGAARRPRRLSCCS
jgi:hypothetical protein